MATCGGRVNMNSSASTTSSLRNPEWAAIRRSMSSLSVRPQSSFKHHSWRQCAHPNVVTGNLPPYSVNKRLYGMFGRRIDGLPMDSLMTRNRGRHHNIPRPLLNHVRQYGPNGMEDTVDVNVDDAVPFFCASVDGFAGHITSRVGE